MRVINQIIAVTLLNLRNLPQRAASSAVAIVGVAAVVLVFAAVLSMAKGFERTMVTTGADDVAIIMRSGSTSEMSSGLSNDQTLLVANAPGVYKDGDKSVVSAELFVIVDVKKKSNNADANVPFRGVQEGAFDVRREIRITDGRMFEPGKNEILVGRGARTEFQGLDVGSTIRFGQTDWNVVGTFEAGGGVAESELWTDVRVLQGTYRRGNSHQVVRAKLDSPESLSILEENLKDDPRIDPDVVSEREFYSSQAEGLTQFIRIVGYPLTILMSVGAIFGALNAMYSSVSVRGKEIATLRALGFGPVPVHRRPDRRVARLCRFQRFPGVDAEWRKLQPGRVQLRGHRRTPGAGDAGRTDHRHRGWPVPGHPGRTDAGRPGVAGVVGLQFPDCGEIRQPLIPRG
jgi:putative ABC transport system permease protein